jgi:hypothetical protein
MIRLPISIGEAVDKLTILDIKRTRVTDKERLVFCNREYELLFTELKDIVDKFKFYYDKLLEVNDLIWAMQDEIRLTESPKPLKCIDILDMNDVRCRIKDIINRLSVSSIREVKGYPKRTALFLSHMGLGDHIGMVGAVNYLSFRYDEIHVACIPHYEKTLTSIYANNPIVKILPLNLSKTVGYYTTNQWQWVAEVNSLVPTTSYTNIYKSGILKQNSFILSSFPDGFYWDINLDPEIRRTYFHIANPNESIELYSHIKDKEYFFIHEKSSNKSVSLVSWDISTTLTIDPNANHYEVTHPWYELAEKFVNQPFLHYIDTIKHASEIHIVDSSFYCLSCFLKTDAKVKHCYDRDTGKVNTGYKFVC